MYTKYEIIKLFGDEYWTYECSDGGTPTLTATNKLRQHNYYNLFITYYDKNCKPHTVEFEDITEIKFKERSGEENEYLDISFIKDELIICIYIINLKSDWSIYLTVELNADGEILESRILDKIIYNDGYSTEVKDEVK